MASLYFEDVTVLDGVEPHFSFGDYLNWLRAGNPYTLSGFQAWAEAQYDGIELGYESRIGDVASLIWVNLPSREDNSLWMVRWGGWPMDLFGGASRRYRNEHRDAVHAALGNPLPAAH